MIKQFVSALFCLFEKEWCVEGGNSLNRKAMNKYPINFNYREVALNYYYLTTRSELSIADADSLEALLDLAEQDAYFAILTHVIDEIVFRYLDLPETDIVNAVKIETAYTIDANLVEICIQELGKQDLCGLDSIIQEYIHLALLPEISEIEAKRMEHILEMAEHNHELEAALSRIDVVTFIHLDLLGARRRVPDTSQMIKSGNVLQGLMEDSANRSMIAKSSPSKRFILRAHWVVLRNIACLFVAAFLGRMCATDIFSPTSGNLSTEHQSKTSKPIQRPAAGAPSLPQATSQSAEKKSQGIPQFPPPQQISIPTMQGSPSRPVILKESSPEIQPNVSSSDNYLEAPRSKSNAALMIDRPPASISIPKEVKQPETDRVEHPPVREPDLPEQKPFTRSEQVHQPNSGEEKQPFASSSESTPQDEKQILPIPPVTTPLVEKTNSDVPIPKNQLQHRTQVLSPVVINPQQEGVRSNARSLDSLENTVNGRNITVHFKGVASNPAIAINEVLSNRNPNPSTEIDGGNIVLNTSELNLNAANSISVNRQNRTGSADHLEINARSFKSETDLTVLPRSLPIANDSSKLLAVNPKSVPSSETTTAQLTHHNHSSLIFKVTPKPALDGFGNHASVDSIGDSVYKRSIQTYAIGLEFSNFGKKRNSLGFMASTEFGNLGAGQTNGLPLYLESFYKHQLTDNISISPGLIWIANPSQNNRSTGDVLVGTLRTSFSF